ncbi:MAG TPA: hypothetical protein VKP64_01180 [Mycobacteriales bacterium]|nr:hypothetical protein [Mycobacteriales bacterium]
MAIVDKSTELSEQVLESLKNGQQAALEAVRRFVETVDKSLPGHGVEPSKRQEILDAAFDMADRLVQTQYDFLHNVVRSAGKALGASPDEPGEKPDDTTE